MQRFEFLDYAEKLSMRHYIPHIGFDDGVALYTIITMNAVGKDTYNVLELGSGSGYSTLWLLYALEDLDIPSYLETVELNTERATDVHNLISSLEGLKTDWRVINDDSINFLRSTQRIYDFIFVDISKSEYATILKLLDDKVRKDSYIAFHNAFFPSPPKDFVARAVDMGWRVSIIPTRLGIFLLSRG